jgi:glutamine amidotransferase
MIGIIDYGMGNLRSVQKAFQHEGADASILASPADAKHIDRLVLPGVGAFADGMAQLRERGWIDAIGAHIASGRPFLGICLGMQLLFTGSEEDAPSDRQLVPGLGVFQGSVRLFRPDPGQRLTVPHMGWNTLSWRRDDALLAGIEQGSAVYFVHSYFVQAEDASVVTATCEYPAGRPFTATVWRDNVWATQFHPEKSQHVGLRMLANFARL